jgi:anti-sigma factor RsiW
METMANVVRRLAPRPLMPPSLRERLLRTVARERSTPTRRQLRIPHRARMVIAGAIAVAALVLIVLLPTYQNWGDDTWRNAISAIVEDHARVLHYDSLTTSDAGVARQWLNARVAFAVNVPEVNGIVLERAEICQLNGLRACLLRYRVDGQPVSYYSYELSRDEIPPETASSATFRQTEEAGYRVVSWQEAGVLHALVADLPADRLVALARACRSYRNRG